MDKHGDFFPENPQDIDELLDSLAQRAAAAQRMLNSMTEEQRQELMELSQQAFGSPQLMEQLARMDANLQALRPGEDWSGSESFEGDQGMGLGDGTGALQDLAQLDALADQLAQSYHGARLDDVDLDALAGQLGPGGGGRREDPAGARAGAARQRLPQARLRRRAAALAQGDAPARQGAAARRGRPDERSLRRPRDAYDRAGGRAVGRDPAVGVRRHRAVGRAAHHHQRGAARRRVAGAACRSTTSRSSRPRPAPRRPSRCWSTRRSRWRWTGGGCR